MATITENQTRAAGIGVLLCLLLGAIGLLSAPAGASAAARPAVIGGEVIASPQQAPWAVFVNITNVATCSGSIIDSTHILTAAHCTDGGATPVSDYQIFAGFAGAPPAPQGEVQERGVVAVRVAPNFSEIPSRDDVAVLTLNTPLNLSPAGVRAIPIVAENAAPALGTLLRTVGFGVTDNTNPPDLHDRSLVQGLVRQRQCNAGLPSTLCSHSETGALCPGDSGSGLTSTTNPPILVGVNDFVTAPPDAACQVGSLSGATNLASPEIHQWLAGNEAPPLAPTTTGYPTVQATEAGRVGGEIICEPPAWTGAPTLGTEFVAVGSEQTLYNGPSNHYLIQPTNLGMTIACVSIATNAGGTTESSGSLQGVIVQPAPPAPKPKSKGPSSKLLRLTVVRHANRWEAQVKVGKLLRGKRASFVWKVSPCASCRKTEKVRLKGEMDVRSPTVGRHAEGVLVVTVPGAAGAGVSYRQSTLRHKLGPYRGRRHHHRSRG
jgi:hypothetical protein